MTMDFKNTESVAYEFAIEIMQNIKSPTEREHIRDYKVKIRSDIGVINITFDFDVVANSIEYGRKKGKYPPPDAIKLWIEKNNIVPKADERGKLPTLNQLTYLISRKIALNGTEGKHYFDIAFSGLESKYKPLFEEAVNKDVEESLKKENEELFS